MSTMRRRLARRTVVSVRDTLATSRPFSSSIVPPPACDTPCAALQPNLQAFSLNNNLGQHIFHVLSLVLAGASSDRSFNSCH